MVRERSRRSVQMRKFEEEIKQFRKSAVVRAIEKGYEGDAAEQYIDRATEEYKRSIKPFYFPKRSSWERAY